MAVIRKASPTAVFAMWRIMEMERGNFAQRLTKKTIVNALVAGFQMTKSAAEKQLQLAIDEKLVRIASKIMRRNSEGVSECHVVYGRPENDIAAGIMSEADDPYCFKCHEAGAGKLVKCGRLPDGSVRMCHQSCLTDGPDIFSGTKELREGAIDAVLQPITSCVLIYRFNELLVSDCGRFVDLSALENPLIRLLVIPMTIDEMRRKYEIPARLGDLLSDFMRFLHNLGVIFGDKAIEKKLTDVYYGVEGQALAAVGCQQCFVLGGVKPKLTNVDFVDWFSAPCPQEHDIVIVRAKGIPALPAKVMNRDNSRIVVRFFDSKNLSYVAKPNECHEFVLEDWLREGKVADARFRCARKQILLLKHLSDKYSHEMRQLVELIKPGFNCANLKVLDVKFDNAVWKRSAGTKKKEKLVKRSRNSAFV